MSDAVPEQLIRVARHYFPVGFPAATDDATQPLHPYQRTPEYQRWQEAWDRALSWTAWEAFLDAVQKAFPGRKAGDVTQPRMASCLRCCVYLEAPKPDGGRFITRVVTAVSVLTPVYLVYVTTQTIRGCQRATRPQLFVEPTDAIRPYADTLAHLTEQVLGYKPFPMQLAETPLPELRVTYLNRTQPTLIKALLSDRLENLP